MMCDVTCRCCCPQTKTLYTDVDPLEEFENDPMTKLKRYAEKNKLRLVDLFRQFDRDGSWSVDRDEFITGVRVSQTNSQRYSSNLAMLLFVHTFHIQNFEYIYSTE